MPGRDCQSDIIGLWSSAELRKSSPNGSILYTDFGAAKTLFVCGRKGGDRCACIGGIYVRGK